MTLLLLLAALTQILISHQYAQKYPNQNKNNRPNEKKLAWINRNAVLSFYILLLCFTNLLEERYKISVILK